MKPYDSYLFDNDGTLSLTQWTLSAHVFSMLLRKMQAKPWKTMDKGTIFVTWSHAELSSLPVSPT
jgi:hypothetical protein